MGGRGGSSSYSRSSGSSSAQGQQQQQPSTQQQSAGVPTSQQLRQMSGGKPNISASTMTKGDWQAMYNAQNPTQVQKSASYDYTLRRPTSTGFSPSQNMNYKLDTGQKLTPREQRMFDGMVQMSRPLGKDVILHRGAHADALAQLGVTNWDNMTGTQLRQALVGAQWDKKSLSSTSYDYSSSPFLSGPSAGGREVVFRIHAAGSTRATAVNPSQAEVVLGPNTHWQITDASFTGKTARPRGQRARKQIMIDVDVWQ